MQKCKKKSELKKSAFKSPFIFACQEQYDQANEKSVGREEGGGGGGAFYLLRVGRALYPLNKAVWLIY